jgi:ABC-2 type transport system ATP-binding protein
MKTGLVIETVGLTKRYGRDLLAVDHLNLRVRRGEVYGLSVPSVLGRRPRRHEVARIADRVSRELAGLGAPPAARPPDSHT